tara:strand:- start:157 stop:333 length:177 start_codon:yes stop_codon:yes gene_type:complete
MAKRKTKKRVFKSYLILSEKTKHLFGAFPYTEDGLTEAEKYVRKITKQNKEKYLIKPS